MLCSNATAQMKDSLNLSSLDLVELEKRAKNAYNNKDFVRAIVHDQIGAEKATTQKKYKFAGKFHQHIGLIHFQINDYEKCIEEYLKALESYEKLASKNELAEIKRLIGDIYLRLDQCDLSFEYLRQSLSLVEVKVGIKRESISLLFQSIGIAHGRCGDLDSALFYFNNALEYAEEPVNPMLSGGILNNIGAIYSKKDMNDLSLQYYLKSEEIFEKDSIIQGVAVSMSNRAYIYQKERKFSKSIELYNKALELFEETNSLIYLRDNYLNVSDVYEEIDAFAKALEFKNKYLELNDSITSVEMLSRTSDLHVQFEIKKKDQELVIAKQQEKIATTSSTLPT